MIPKPKPIKKAVLSNGLELCQILRGELVDKGYYPALTGGLIYKNGPRKDIDIVIYRNRQDHDHFEMSDIFGELEQCGLENIEYYGFVTKAKWKGFTVDLFNPETNIEFNEQYGDED